MDGFSEGGILCLEGATVGGRGSMPLVDEGTLAEEYQDGATVFDSTSIQKLW